MQSEGWSDLSRDPVVDMRLALGEAVTTYPPERPETYVVSRRCFNEMARTLPAHVLERFEVFDV